MPDQTENLTPAPLNRGCEECGKPLPADAPGGVCPACLMNIGLESVGDEGATITAASGGSTTAPSSPVFKSPNNLTTGQQFGDYKIGRLLGKGGMGEVYEAEDVDSGRQVAIKVLGTRIDSPEARKRFLREGRMAAAINHPNSVYIYGTEEIDGQSVISMELVGQGTLKDKLKEKGELSIGEAVDDILQVISGLSAAHDKGVLHRDIKPSNCFVDRDGSVKVGDFGLSVSSIAHENTQLTMTGAVMGTPAFASPEQLRGDPLDVRSDIYSVGATLYYLLAGKPPFDGQNVVQLLATVLDKTPESIRKKRDDVPENLAQVIMRCLAKQPDARYRDYASLERALAPFGSRAATPATLGLRFFANVIDMVLMGLLVHMPLWVIGTATSQDMSSWPAMFFGASYAEAFAMGMLIQLLYFAVPEGLWGASLGKAICQMRIVDRSGSRIGVTRAVLRTLVYAAATAGPSLVYQVIDPGAINRMHSNPSALDIVISYSFLIMVGILFCRARRTNGYSAFHDLVTGSRVVGKHAIQTRSKVRQAADELVELENAEKVGPYHALASFENAAVGDIVPGFDLQLRRRVWIRKAAEDSVMMSREDRSRNRITRVRWINGSRKPGSCWDAFEYLSGQPLANLLGKQQEWKSVRYWLLDLAEEFEAAGKDDSLPEVIAVDRVWITADGRAKLLDFRSPGINADPSDIDVLPRYTKSDLQAGTLLKAFAEAVLKGRGETPPPSYVKPEIAQFPELQPTDLTAKLVNATERMAEVSRIRRFSLIALCMLPCLFAATTATIGIYVFNTRESSDHSLERLHEYLVRLDYLDRELAKPEPKQWQKRQKPALETYISGAFREAVLDTNLWHGPFGNALIKDRHREFVEELMTRPKPDPDEFAAAEKSLQYYFERSDRERKARREDAVKKLPQTAMNTALIIFTFTTLIPGLIAALLFRGGVLMRVLGLAFVTADGQPAARWRVLFRNFIMWAPILTLVVVSLARRKGMIDFSWELGAGLVLYAICLAIALVRPSRGVQDVIAGTWLVPR